jgi:hypothetical protein
MHELLFARADRVDFRLGMCGDVMELIAGTRDT